MKCPRCKSEITNNAICPYCGYDVRSATVDWSYSQWVNTSTQDPGRAARKNSEYSNLYRRIVSLETKLNLSIILLAGNFVLLLLVLIMNAL